ncbi:hypothetical protein JOM56_004178 [Amanita muscaria]
MRCAELSRLGKPPRWSSVKFLRRAPGSVGVLLSPFPSKNVVDPAHPAVATKIDRRAFPGFYHDAFRMKAYPLALLEKNEWDSGRDPQKLPTALDPVPENKKQVDMHLSIATSIKNTSKSAVVRMAISRRVKHAIELIIARGANAGDDIERKVIFDDQEAKEMGPKWVLNGWMYIFHPTLKLYRMPYHDLIPQLRTALQMIHDRGMRLEHQWEKLRARQPDEKKQKQSRGPEQHVSRNFTNHRANGIYKS